MPSVSKTTPFPRIPPMNQLLEQADGALSEPAKQAAGAEESTRREAVRRAISAELDQLRLDVLSGQARELDQNFWQQVGRRLEVVPNLQVRGALNATGVVLHTNLGRAPWCSEAVAAAAAASSAAVLEVDPGTGKRGRRERAIDQLLVQITGAEAGLPVNNNAAALLLSVAALGGGHKTVLARGEMVEIGGSYRMPEVVVAAGSELVEVGTTNRVHLHDYEKALQDPDVRCVLKVHRSNFEQHGFVGEPTSRELADLCHKYAVPLVYDLGSGVLWGKHLPGADEEPTVSQALSDGCDVVTFSGDKLLGGPQAGLIVGAAALLARLRSHMLTRCLRLDKSILAALEATLSIHALGERSALTRLPALRQLALTEADLMPRAISLQQRIQEQLPTLTVQAVACNGRVGSGAAPIRDLPGAGLTLQAPNGNVQQWAHALRTASPPIFPRLQDEQILIDCRTIEHAQEELLIQQLALSLTPFL